MKLIIINGPNLNLLGIREKSIYGDSNFGEYLDKLRHNHTDVEIDYYQSNCEGDLINKIHEVGFSYDGIILNAGGYTHTSVALTDAISAVTTPTVEVHISNIHSREKFRHHSYLTRNCVGIIAGFGLKGYELGIEYFKSK